MAEGGVYGDSDDEAADLVESEAEDDFVATAPLAAPARTRGGGGGGGGVRGRVHVPTQTAKALPRATSMIPKRRRKGSVAMEDVAMGRAYVWQWCGCWHWCGAGGWWPRALAWGCVVAVWRGGV